MSFKLGEKNIVAWSFVAALQVVALMLLIPVAGTIHQKYFAMIFGNTPAWFLAIAYGLAEVLGFAMLPMMHTAWKNKRIRLLFPATLICFMIAIAYDVYINNDIFKKRQAEYAQNLIENHVERKVSTSVAVLELKSRLDKTERNFSENDNARTIERNRNRIIISKYDSLSLAYAGADQPFYAKRYSDMAERLRADIRASESASQKEKLAIEKMESQYRSEIEKETSQAKSEGKDVATAEASNNYFNDFCKHYPGVIFLVLAVIVSGISGFVVDKYELIIYEVPDRREVARKRWTSMLLDLAIAKIFKRNDPIIEKKIELAAEVRFLDDRTMATKQLYEMELTRADQKFKGMGIYPRQAFATQFHMSLQAVHNRLKDYERKLLDSNGQQGKNGNGNLAPSLPSGMDA